MQRARAFGNHFVIHVPDRQRQADAAKGFQQGVVTVVVARQGGDVQFVVDFVDDCRVVAEVQGDDFQRRVFVLCDVVEQRQFFAAGRAPDGPDVEQGDALFGVALDDVVQRCR